MHKHVSKETDTQDEQLHRIVIKSDTIHVMVKFSVVTGHDDALRRRRSDIFYFCQ